jgi:putative addiction module killer protein
VVQELARSASAGSHRYSYPSLVAGQPWRCEPVGEGVLELRIDYGPGYRVYFVHRGQALVVLLAGGDKRTQERDIRTALELAREL